MDFNEQTIDKLADLLMIGLTPEENKMVLDEFEIIDKNINKINKIEGIEKAEPMTHALDNFECKLREDVAEESPAIEDLLANCDFTDDREVEVPKVVD
jgi:aspartyl/glutamyl-tRNA(Asn/Gln) amidotransferase C subunit